jgi:hypothetical protein
MFESESDLLLTIKQYDEIVRECLSEKITFEEFMIKYNSFHYYALDGHGSDEEEQNLFEKHKDKILPHLEIMEKLLGYRPETGAVKDPHTQANHFGSEEGLRYLKEICEKYNI